jgi:hypothetical protein
MEGMIMLGQDVLVIRYTLNAERRMREIVFSGHKRDVKVAEIDRALMSLDRVEERLREAFPDHFVTQGRLL